VIAAAVRHTLVLLPPALYEPRRLPSRIRRGTYCGVSGPTYETEHEVAMLRTIGGDAGALQRCGAAVNHR